MMMVKEVESGRDGRSPLRGSGHPDAGYTPGPWTPYNGGITGPRAAAATFPDLEGRRQRWIRQPETRRLIAVIHYCADNEEHVEADAHLISSAPDLYEALDDLERAIAYERSGCGELETWMDAFDTLEAAREKARAALSRARGESAPVEERR